MISPAGSILVFYNSIWKEHNLDYLKLPHYEKRGKTHLYKEMLFIQEGHTGTYVKKTSSRPFLKTVTLKYFGWKRDFTG